MKEFFGLLDDYFAEVAAMFTTPLFNLGNDAITLNTVVFFILAFVVLGFVAKYARSILVGKILRHTSMQVSMQETIGNTVRFMILAIGSVIIFQSAGIDLSALSLLAGALGVGIGFGLRNVTDNFISGLIIMIEKPIKVGDRIEVGGVNGDVISISIRSTTVMTNDNISIIVPNSEFISQQVINWSHNDRNIRFRFPVGVSYNEDPEKVKKILLDIARENPFVLKSPEPDVLFTSFGDSSLDFLLAVWTSTHINKPAQLKSALYFEIFRRFKIEGIEIPFPQRDLHIKTGLHLPKTP